MCVQGGVERHDFRDGIYYTMPDDPRGAALIKIQKKAQQRTKEIEKKFANLSAEMRLVSKASDRPSQQREVLFKTHKFI